MEYWLQKGHIRENFDTENLPFSVCRFEKGEYLTRQDGRLAELLFLIEGEVQIYGIREDGSVTPVNRHEAPALLGDAEFVMGGASSLFTEARTTVICAALPMEPYRAELDRDVKFLHLLLRSYAGKFHTMATLEASAKTIEERVLLYMRHASARHPEARRHRRRAGNGHYLLPHQRQPAQPLCTACAGAYLRLLL